MGYEKAKMILNKIKEIIAKKRILYMVCFFLLMLIDWTRGSQVGSTWAWTVNMTGVIMAIIMFSAYDYKVFLKPIYIIYSLMGVIALPLAYWWWNLHQVAIYRDKLLTAVLNVWLLGILIIKLVEDVVIQKTKKLNFTKLEIVTAAMLLWMLFSVNEDIWPLWYLIMFGLFYHTDYSDEDIEEMKQGMLNGIMVAFFALQGAAFVFRPFDDGHDRYCGIYANCNINALFYCVVWIAFLVKLFYLRKEGAKKWQRLVCFLFCGALMGFMILTISKTAWISAILIGICYIVFADFVFLKKKAGNVTCFILTLFLVMCISIPIVYSAVRYIPPIFHHPIWYEGEYREDKVHSFDPWDSEKYVSYEEFTTGVYERIKPIFELVFKDNPMGIKIVHASEEPVVRADQKYKKEDWETYSSILGRIEIWRYYLNNGTLMGHSSTEGHEFGLGDWYVWHAQNVFVQFWYYYGIPSALLLAIVGVWAVLCSVQKMIRGNEKSLICLLYLVLFAAYGLFECVWYPGQMILFLAFFTPKFLINSQRQ